MTKFFIWVILATLTSCRPASRKDQTDNPQDQLMYDSANTAIIAWDRSFNYPFDTINYNAATLTQEDIKRVDSLLISSVMDYNNSLTDGHEEYKIDLNGKNYKKQLIGAINSNGEKEIWVNCFCDSWVKSWKTEILVVDDGGPCYFNFKINMQTKKIYNFVVNGFA